MKYLRLFESHSSYEATTIEDFPCVVYDNSEVHYLTKAASTSKSDPINITQTELNTELD